MIHPEDIVAKLLEDNEDPKQAIERNPDFEAGVKSLGDFHDYVEGYVLEYAPESYTPQNVQRVTDILRKELGQQWPDVFGVFQAMEMAGLGRCEDFENAFYEHEGD